MTKCLMSRNRFLNMKLLWSVSVIHTLTTQLWQEVVDKHRIIHRVSGSSVYLRLYIIHFFTSAGPRIEQRMLSVQDTTSALFRVINGSPCVIGRAASSSRGGRSQSDLQLILQGLGWSRGVEKEEQRRKTEFNVLTPQTPTFIGCWGTHSSTKKTKPELCDMIAKL